MKVRYLEKKSERFDSHYRAYSIKKHPLAKRSKKEGLHGKREGLGVDVSTPLIHLFSCKFTSSLSPWIPLGDIGTFVRFTANIFRLRVVAVQL